jgi:LemA protein
VIIVFVVVLLAIAIALYAWLTYNRLVRLRLAAANSWAQIDVALKLRHDLVPSLVQTVSGYASHERATFERTALARGSAIGAVGAGPARQGPLEGALALGIRSLIGLAEAYPDLKASENFAALQRDLASIEERIAITRRVYNDTVQTLNTAIAVFPSSLVARAFGFGAREFFTTGGEAANAPAVDLAPSATQ